jgi:hypothetical protein
LVALLDWGRLCWSFRCWWFLDGKLFAHPGGTKPPLVLSGVLSLLMIIVEFAGSTGVRNTSRLYQFSGLCLSFCVPLGWMYVRRRSDTHKSAAVDLPAVTMFGGIILAGIQIPAMQQPVYSYFLSDLDVQWNVIIGIDWNRMCWCSINRFASRQQFSRGGQIGIHLVQVQT